MNGTDLLKDTYTTLHGSKAQKRLSMRNVDTLFSNHTLTAEIL